MILFPGTFRNANLLSVGNGSMGISVDSYDTCIAAKRRWLSLHVSKAGVKLPVAILWPLLLCIIVCCYAPRCFGQCDSAYFTINATGGIQHLNDKLIILESPTNAYEIRLNYENITGYFLGKKNATESIRFELSSPVKHIRITARALSAAQRKVEYFVLQVNDAFHAIQPGELTTPDPDTGSPCILQADGTLKGDTISKGDGSFIFNYYDPFGITSFQITDSVASLTPEGAVFDVQIYDKCPRDTTTAVIPLRFKVPNSFSPNGDGRNDLFKPVITGTIAQYELIIYNRWGQSVFTTKDPLLGWDGKQKGQWLSSGVYLWVCRYRGAVGVSKEERGTVLLLR